MKWRLANCSGMLNILCLQTCVSVYQRSKFDHVDIKWPANAEVNRCFILSDQDNQNSLYIIAGDEAIAK